MGKVLHMQAPRNILPDFTAKIAMRLWTMGHDTREIADRIEVKESAVYNTLSMIREARRAGQKLD